MTPVPYRVEACTPELDDSFTLTLAPPPGSTVPAFEPGQFNMLYAFGAGEVPISISGDPGAGDNKLVHTIRAVGPVTVALQRLVPGAMVGVRGPYGTAWPMQKARGSDLVIITGGIGLAPLRPAIYQALRQRSDYSGLSIYYGARQPAEILYPEQLALWGGRFDVDVGVTVDRAASDWTGRVGVVTALLQRPVFDPAHCTALVCGPEVMMRHSIRTLQGLGVADECIFVSMERNMKCAVGFCGHCQLGPYFVCRDGAVFPYPAVAGLMRIAEL